MSSTAQRARRAMLGRDDDAHRLDALLAESQLVTLTGPGGIGKTTLATWVAAPRDDRASPVDLTQVDHAAAVPFAVAAALGLVLTEADDATAAIAQYLRSRRTLLVLDNVERRHEIGRQVQPWLAMAPGLRVLVTSRVPLGIPEEREFPVGGLRLPVGDGAEEVAASPSGGLFLRIARQVGALDVLDDDAARDLARLLRRLDGMPLAIELAAGRSRVLTPGGLLRRLEDPTVVAVAPGHDVDARQASLDLVLGMTLDELAAPERRLLAALSICPGSFDLDLAAELVPDVAIIAAMEALLVAGLVRREDDVAGEARFRLLETIRMRAARELPEEDRATLAARHARAVASMAASVGGIPPLDPAMVQARFQAEDDNIAAAVAWSVDHDPSLGLGILVSFQAVAQSGVRLERSVRWYRSMLAAAPDGDPSRAPARSALLRLVTRYAGPEEAIRLEPEVLAGIEDEPRPLQRATYLSLAYAHYALGDTDGVSRLNALAAAASDDPEDAAALRLDAEANLAWVVDGDAVRSASLFARSAAAHARTGRQGNQAISLFKQALAELRAGLTGEAATTARQSVSLCPPGNVRAFARSVLALALAEDGDSAGSWDAVRAAWQEVERETPVDRVEVLEAAAVATAAAGRPLAAIVAATVADRVRLTTGWQREPHVAVVLERWRERSVRSVGSARAMHAAEAAATTTIEAAMAQAVDSMRAGVGIGRAVAERLTRRELEVLALVAQGQSDGQIAAALFISPKTASVHVANIKGKLGLDSRLQVALHARAVGMASDPELAIN